VKHLDDVAARFAFVHLQLFRHGRPPFLFEVGKQ
jgi:hypothetical protein